MYYNILIYALNTHKSNQRKYEVIKMKKVIALLLAAVMSLSLVACGGSETSEKNSDTSVETEAKTATVETQESTDTTAHSDPAEAETTLSDNATPSFDTSWASNDFEALLPELPFEGWTTSQESDSVYEMELGGLKDQVITDDNGNTIGYGEDKEKLIDYLDSLTDYGFSVEETGGIEGYEYEWLVTDPNGNQIEVTCAEGYCWITITKQ